MLLRVWFAARASRTSTSVVFKNFPITEKSYVQFRLETFNTFNHPQFNKVDTNAQFDQTGQQVNAHFGQIIGDYLPRQMQLALKVIF